MPSRIRSSHSRALAGRIAAWAGAYSAACWCLLAISKVSAPSPGLVKAFLALLGLPLLYLLGGLLSSGLAAVLGFAARRGGYWAGVSIRYIRKAPSLFEATSVRSKGAGAAYVRWLDRGGRLLTPWVDQEVVGDGLETLGRLEREGAPRWRLYGVAFRTAFWAIIYDIRERFLLPERSHFVTRAARRRGRLASARYRTGVSPVLARVAYGRGKKARRPGRRAASLRPYATRASTALKNVRSARGFGPSTRGGNHMRTITRAPCPTPKNAHVQIRLRGLQIDVSGNALRWLAVALVSAMLAVASLPYGR